MIVRGTSSFSGQSSPALSPAPPAGATPLHRASSAAAPSPLVPQRSTPLQRAYSASLRSSAAPGLGMTSAPPTTPAASSARSAASVTPSPALAAALARAATAAMPTSAPAPSVADAAAALAGWPGGMPPSPLLLASAVGMAPTAPLPSVGLAPNGQPAPFWASPPPFAMPPPFTASPPPGVDPALFALHLQQWYVQYYTAMMQLGPMGGMSVGAAAQSAASMLTSAPPGTRCAHVARPPRSACSLLLAFTAALPQRLLCSLRPLRAACSRHHSRVRCSVQYRWALHLSPPPALLRQRVSSTARACSCRSRRGQSNLHMLLLFHPPTLVPKRRGKVRAHLPRKCANPSRAPRPSARLAVCRAA